MLVGKGVIPAPAESSSGNISRNSGPSNEESEDSRVRAPVNDVRTDEHYRRLYRDGRQPGGKDLWCQQYWQGLDGT